MESATTVTFWVTNDSCGSTPRLAEGRFYVVCLGQFKRGKSTLLNALVAASVLPTGVAPVTSVVTVLRYGDRIAVRVRTTDSDWRDVAPESLTDYVSEERNPGNIKRVVAVEVFVPAALLHRGLCLVDTPGIGSVFADNTTATRDFLPQIDAALVVLGADPPITGDELALTGEVAERVPHRLFVLAKADRLSDREREEATLFTKRVLSKRLRTAAETGLRIIEVSAAEVLATGQPTRDWSLLVDALEDLAAGSGSELVAGAERRGTMGLVARLLSTIDEQIAVIQRPLVESEARLAALKAGLTDARRALRDLAPLLAAEEARLLSTVEANRDEWLRTAIPGAGKELETSLRFLSDRGPALRERALGEATVVARRWLDDWSRRQAPEIDGLFRAGMQRFLDLLATVEKALVAAAREQAGSLTIEPGLRAPSHYYMTEMLASTPASVGKQLLDLIPSARRSATIRRDAALYLGQLLDVNSARVKNDFRERLSASRRTVEGELRGRLDDMGRTAEQWLERARALHHAGQSGVDTEIHRLRALRDKADQIRVHLAAGCPDSSAAIS